MRPRRPAPGGQAEQARRRQAWLELVATSGPFITLPVADRAMPNGPPAVAEATRARLRALVEDTLGGSGGPRDQLIDAVLTGALDWADHHVGAAAIPDALAEPVAEAGIILRPDFAFYARRRQRGKKARARWAPGPRRRRRC